MTGVSCLETQIAVYDPCEGGWSKRDDSIDRLCEWDSDKGEGVQKFCGRHLSIAPKRIFLYQISDQQPQLP